MGAARGIVERVERALELAAELDYLGAVWELDADGARARARELEASAARGEELGPLAGSVCGWKDCFDVAGLHTSGGAPWRARASPVSSSATVVQRLEAAGAISLGKLAMTQLAWGMMGQTPGRPACRNPHDRERVPGGSSSGSAVAVATGIVDHAPGTDAGGSVRHPAAACGVVGFKPTYGSVPLDGCLPYAPSFDTGGAIARSVPEVALQHAVISATPQPDLAGGLDDLRAAFLGGYFTAALEDDVAEMLERARGRVRAREIDLAWTQNDNRAMAPIFTAEPGAFVLGHDPRPDPAHYDGTTFADVERSRSLPAIEYLQGRAHLAEARRRCAAAAAGCDILLCGSAPCPPVVIDGPDKTTRMNALTKPFNALGWPALSLFAGFDSAGLPLGLQVVGLPGHDALVLRAAAALEVLLQD
ncbi:MAG TPA: amidase [Gaiellales bacterium]|jgi:aspartyl-tRNA(Asn)/glutamyl-tRNA(Gln) amidotransferase subunit A|nr:amidase [Gaiellales bacterium]